MPAWARINAKMVGAQLSGGQTILARRGAMLAYKGDVTFTSSATGGGSLGGFVGRMVAGEQIPLMVSEGTGYVMYGHAGMQVKLIEVTGDQLSVEADKLLAYDGQLQAGTQFLGKQGGLRSIVQGQISGQGLFTTTISGQGTAALLSHGPIFELQVGGGEVAIDPQAYVAHRGDVEVKLDANVSWRDAVGAGSGEAFQLKLTGQGTAYVQASERKV